MAYFNITGSLGSPNKPNFNDGSIIVNNPGSWTGRNDKTDTLTINYRLGDSGSFETKNIILKQPGVKVFNVDSEHYKPSDSSYDNSRRKDISSGSTIINIRLNLDPTKTVFVLFNGTETNSIFNLGSSGMLLAYLNKDNEGIYTNFLRNDGKFESPASISLNNAVSKIGTVNFNNFSGGYALKSISIPELAVSGNGGIPPTTSTTQSKFGSTFGNSALGTEAAYDISLRFDISSQTNNESYDQGIVLRVFKEISDITNVASIASADYIDYLIVLSKNGTAFVQIKNGGVSGPVISDSSVITIGLNDSKTFYIDTNSYWYATLS